MLDGRPRPAATFLPSRGKGRSGLADRCASSGANDAVRVDAKSVQLRDEIPRPNRRNF